MKVLNREELRMAEGVLLQHLPKSYKVYGFLYYMNRNKPTTHEVMVDTWPDFKVIVCRPDPKNKLALDLMNKVTCFCTDEQALRKALTEEKVIDWSTYFVIGGLDHSHTPLLKEISHDRKIECRHFTLVRLLHLPDASFLKSPAVDSEIESKVSSLSLSHMELVNQTWKFGRNQKGYNIIKNLITNFPSFCIIGEQGQPVSWIMVYDYGAMGILYTLPEHRGKGYAKALICTMAKKLFAESQPVFCFIEEDNTLSYKLFKDVGFVVDETFRAVWLEFNF